MNDWDDLRFFLALARKASVTAAAAALGVNHSTVSRRIGGFEQALNVRLFDRLSSGYTLTPAGEEMLAMASKIEHDVATIDRQLLARDTQMCGSLRVTAPMLLVEVLMPKLAHYSARYPGVDLQLITSDQHLNLSTREADVAIRSTTQPPQHLIGRPLSHCASALYASNDYLARHQCTAQTITDAPHHRLIGWNTDKPAGAWGRQAFALAREACRVDSKIARLHAAKASLGIAQLPCFLADPEPDLQRLSAYGAQTDAQIWVLTHPDLRGTARVRAFVDVMVSGFAQDEALFAGTTPVSKAATTALSG